MSISYKLRIQVITRPGSGNICGFRVIGRATALKFTPDLRFVIDETFDRMDDARAMFGQANVRRDLDADEGE